MLDSLAIPEPARQTILVVDDEPEILKLVDAILSGHGYNIVLASGSEIAVRTFEQMNPRPDLILTDVVMPGMSGPMLIEQILAIDPSVPVLFMSGYDDRQVVQKYVVDQGHHLIAKPFTFQKLGASVKEILDAVPAH